MLIRSIISLLSVLLFINFSFAQPQNLVYNNNHYNIGEGHEKMMRINHITGEQIFSYNFTKKRVTDSTVLAFFSYDDSGRMVKKSVSNDAPAGLTITTFRYDYNALNQLTRLTAYNENLKFATIYEYEYDSLGNELFSYEFNKDKSRLIVHKYFYNDSNKLVGTIFQQDENDPYTSSRYYYNSKGDIERSEEFDSTGKFTSITTYTYDSAAKKVSEFVEDRKGKRLNHTYFNDSEGNLVKVKDIYVTSTIYPDGREDKQDHDREIELLYNSDNLIYQITTYIDKNKESLIRHHYNKAQ